MHIGPGKAGARWSDAPCGSLSLVLLRLVLPEIPVFWGGELGNEPPRVGKVRGSPLSAALGCWLHREHSAAVAHTPHTQAAPLPKLITGS